MLEIDRLNEITFDNFKNAIDSTLSNKIFIKNKIENMPNLTRDEQLASINNIYFTKNSSSLIKTINNIEWTPVKLYQTGYYVVNMYNNFWIVSHNSYDGFVVKYFLKYTDYIDILFNATRNLNIAYLEQYYWCSNYELAASSNFLEQNKDTNIIMIKQMLFPNSTLKINHYIYKDGNNIYYLPYSNSCIFKPLLYKTI